LLVVVFVRLDEGGGEEEEEEEEEVEDDEDEDEEFKRNIDDKWNSLVSVLRPTRTISAEARNRGSIVCNL